MGVLWRLAGGVAVLTAGTVVYGGWRWVTPPRIRQRRSAALPGRRYQEVRFTSADGLPLYGLFLAGSGTAPILVLCHGYYRSLAELLPLGLDLNDLGYNVLLFDFRGCGRSAGRHTSVGQREVEDVVGAVRYVRGRSQGRLAVGVLSVSMGAAAAIMAAARSPEIAALVADSPYAILDDVVDGQVRAMLRLAPLVALGRLAVRAGERLMGVRVASVRPVDHVGRLSPRPILFIYGSRDEYIPRHHPKALFQRAADPKFLWTAAESGHAMARFDQRQGYLERVDAFFRRYLWS